MFLVISKTLASLRHKAIWWIMLASIAMSLVMLIGFIWLINEMLTTYQLVNIAWVETLIENLGVIFAGVIAWFIFPVAVPAIAALFEDKTAEIIEANEYGVQEAPYSYPWVKEIGFLLFGLFLNLLFLPVYVIPVINIIAYYLLNSWLVGKGLFLLIATRYHGQENARKLAKQNSIGVKLYGLLIVLMTNIPFVNLIAPLFGIIMMVHYARALKITE